MTPTAILGGCSSELLDEVAWYCGNTDTPQIVGQLWPNAWGVYDAVGNVYEWTEEPEIRGGGWSSPVEDLDVTTAYSADLLSWSPDVGFRPVRTL